MVQIDHKNGANAPFSFNFNNVWDKNLKKICLTFRKSSIFAG